VNGPKYVNGKEVGPRKKPPTAEQINKSNKAFWDARAQPPPPPEAFTHPGVPPLVAQANIMNLREAIRETRARTEATVLSTVKAAKKAEQVKGGKENGKVRKNKNVKRDRRIHDAHADGKTPKQIEGDKKIRGKKLLSASQIRRILKDPRP
jgi:hypothetical protein